MPDEVAVRRSFELAGTVALPPTFPELGEISLTDLAAEPALKVTQRAPPQVALARTVLLRDVRALFLPRDPKHPDLSDVEGWYFLDRDHSPRALQTAAKDLQAALSEAKKVQDRRSAVGLVYVPEHAPVLTEVQAGMTGAESAEYYPPFAPGPCRVAWCRAEE